MILVECQIHDLAKELIVADAYDAKLPILLRAIQLGC